MLSYRIPPNFTPVITSHGNSKSDAPFFPTLPSTKVEIGIHCKSLGPKHALGIVSDKLGGILDANSPCELLRNERQVAYMKSQAKSDTLSLIKCLQ